MIKQPASIHIYEHNGVFQMELFRYDARKRQPMHLWEKVICEGEEKRNSQTEKWQRKFHIYEHHELQGKEDIGYEPHRRLIAYQWTPTDLKHLFNSYLEREYGVKEACVSVEFDLYKGNLVVMPELDEEMEQYDELEAKLEAYFGSTKVGYFRFDEFWQDAISDIIGKKFAYCYLEETDLYNYAEITWQDERSGVPVWFYFYED